MGGNPLISLLRSPKKSYPKFSRPFSKEKGMAKKKGQKDPRRSSQDVSWVSGNFGIRFSPLPKFPKKKPPKPKIKMVFPFWVPGGNAKTPLGPSWGKMFGAQSREVGKNRIIRKFQRWPPQGFGVTAADPNSKG